MASRDEGLLIDTIYEAALNPTRWSDVMRDLGRVLDSHTGAVIAVCSPSGGTGGIFSSADRTSSIADYKSRWAKSRPQPAVRGTLDILSAGAGLALGSIRSDASLMCRREMERSTF